MTKQEKKRKKELDAKNRNQSLTIIECIELCELNKLYEEHEEKVYKRVEIALCITIGMLLATYLIEKLF
jgi:hypothetical protein